MPTVISDTDTWPQTIQRPSNGELADSASLAQFADALAKRTRYAYNRGRSYLFDITRAPYNADPTAVALSSTAIQNAASDAFVAGGDVFLPPGIFKYTALTIPKGVNLYGVPGATWLINAHASADQITFTGASDGNPSLICDVRFVSQIAATGTGIVNSSGARVILERCIWNGFEPGGAPSNALQGKIATVNGASSELAFIDCRINAAGNIKALHANGGKIAVVRGALSMPATFADALAYSEAAAEVTLDGVHFDLTAHTTGTSELLFVAGFSSSKGALRDCVIKAPVSGGITNYGLYWDQGAIVSNRGNIYDDTSRIAPLGSSDLAANGSHIELEPSISLDIGSGNPTWDLRPYNRYDSILVKSQGTSGCAIRLPVPLFRGQRLEFSYFNNTPSNVNVTFTDTPLTASLLPNPVGPGIVLTGVFVWESRDSTTDYRWVQKGGWGAGLTIV